MVDDARVMIVALAQPEALLVFGAIATATSTARLLDELGYPMSRTSHITPFGLEKKTSLPRDVIENAARRLERLESRWPYERSPALSRKPQCGALGPAFLSGLPGA